MDIVDKATYQFEWDGERNLAEETRRAFVELLNQDSMNATLVVRHLIHICKWQDQTEYNDPVIEAKWNSLRGVILEIKKQLNMKPIETGEGNE